MKTVTMTDRELQEMEERSQLMLVGLYLILTAVMAVLGMEHARRARGARLGRWQGGRWA